MKCIESFDFVTFTSEQQTSDNINEYTGVNIESFENLADSTESCNILNKHKSTLASVIRISFGRIEAIFLKHSVD